MPEPSDRKSRPPLALIVWGAAGAALVAGMAWLLWPRAIEVQTAAIDRGEVQRVVLEDARTEVRDLYEVATTVPGRLKRIDLEAGDRVIKGQPLLHIDASSPALLDGKAAVEARAAVTAAQEVVRAAETDLALSQKQLQRTQQLADTGFAAPAALDRSQAAADAARANLKKAKADLYRAQAIAGGNRGHGQDYIVRSPIDGVVLRVLRESQVDLPAGATVMEIGNPEQLQVTAEYLSRDAALMKPGLKARISGVGQASISGRVRVVEPYARTKVSALGVEEQRVRVLIDIDPKAGLATLGHGYQVDAGVVVFHAKDVLRVPTDALVRNNGGWAVFLVTNDKATLTPVTIGDGDGRFRQVDKGLSEGDVVILFPGDEIRDGDRVTSKN